MVLARGHLDADNPHIFETQVPYSTFRQFSTDRAWTGRSFGSRVLTVAIPATAAGFCLNDRRQVRLDWQTIRRTIKESPSLFDSMLRRDPNVSK